MNGREDPIRQVSFEKMNLADPFFDSLRKSYDGFDRWFRKKAATGEPTYAIIDQVSGSLMAMLYLKSETDPDTDINPPLTLPRMKIGTFKVDFDHHTSVGKRLLAIALRRFAESGYEYAYVTMFDTATTRPLRRLMEEYGFVKQAIKTTTGENVLFKRRPRKETFTATKSAFPFIDPDRGHDYLLAIRSDYHDRLYGDTQLKTQYGEPIKDDRTVNTIEKVYLSGALNGGQIVQGDHVVSYRMKPYDEPAAYYTSVISSVGTVTEVRNIRSFPTAQDFLTYIKGRSVFTEQELKGFYASGKYPWIINFLYNFRFERYPNRGRLLEEGIIQEKQRIVCSPITKESFKRILALGEIDESYVLD